MSIVGHPKVTKRAYAQDTETRRAAVQFAEACVHNGLGKDISLLSEARVLQLKAQIERDFLVCTLTSQERRGCNETVITRDLRIRGISVCCVHQQRRQQMKPETAEVLKNLRNSAEGDEINGFCPVYLDNAKKGMPVHKFRAQLAQLSKIGLYRVVDGYAWGDVKMEGGE